MKELFKSIVFIIVFLTAAVVAGMFIASCSSKNSPILLNGAGASFPFPIYSVWSHAYSQDPNGALINYQSIGSGAGIKQVSEGTVEFGASDEPLQIEELQNRKLFQIPMVGGAVAIGFKIFGIQNLRLDGPSLVDIYLGKITNWNNPVIQALNPDVKLPDLSIKVVHRADGSGTTWLFTNYLSSISSKWKSDVGGAKVVNWPLGVGGKGNEGVAVYISQLDGSIGYIEASYAEQNNITTIALKNADGNFVKPSINAVKETLTNTKWDVSKGFYQTFINMTGPNTWPIIGVSYILIPMSRLTEQKRQALYRYLIWCYANGSATAEALGYVVPPTFDIKKELSIRG